VKVKQNNRANKKRNWTELRIQRSLRRLRNRVKASQSVDCCLMAVPDTCYVRVYAPGRLLAASKLRAR
jgi:hypothetical protein